MSDSNGKRKGKMAQMFCRAGKMIQMLVSESIQRFLWFIVGMHISEPINSFLKFATALVWENDGMKDESILDFLKNKCIVLFLWSALECLIVLWVIWNGWPAIAINLICIVLKVAAKLRYGN